MTSVLETSSADADSTRRQAAIERRAEWRAHWPLTAATTLAYLVSVTHIFTLGIFIVAVEAEFGWSRAELSLGLSITSFIAGPLVPLIGFAVDRYGSRRIGILGMGAYCLCIASYGLVSSSIWSWWACSALLGFAYTLVKPPVWAAAISRTFDKGRGLALAVMMMGGGLGQALFPTITYSLIESLGWRVAYFVIGGASAAITIPLLVVFFRENSAPGSKTEKTAEKSGESGGYSVRQLFTNLNFYRLTAASMLVSMCVSAMIVHLVPILHSKTMEMSTAVGIVALAGVAGVIGRLACGWLLDRGIRATAVGAGAFTLGGLAAVALLTLDGDNRLGASVAVILLGLTLGAEFDVLAYLTGRFFGLKRVGFAIGMVSGMVTLGTGLGPLIAGAVFDSHRSYDAALIGFIAVFAVSILIVLSMGTPPDWRKPAPPDPEKAGASDRLAANHLGAS